MKQIDTSGAEKIVRLSLQEAKELPNMLGFMAPAAMKEHGYYSCRINNVKTLFLLEESK